MLALRDVCAVVLAVLAAILIAASIPAVWLAENVVDEDGFMAIAEPLGSDPQVQQQLSDEAVSGLIEDSSVPDWAAERIEPLAQEQARKLVGTEAYQQMWGSSMRELHHQLFTPGPAELSIDLTPLASGIIEPIESVLPIDLPQPENLDVPIASIPRMAILEKATLLDPWAGRLLPAGVICAAVALLIGGHRRAVLLIGGLAGMVAGGLLLWGLGDLEALVPDVADQRNLLGPVVRGLEDQMVADARPQAILLCCVSTLITVGAIVMMGLRRSR